MTRTIHPSLFLIPLFVGCAAVPGPGSRLHAIGPASDENRAAEERTPALPPAAQPGWQPEDRPERVPPEHGDETGPGAAELELWNSPQFRRQFAASYSAETDIEPRISAEEREKMQQVLQFISAGQMQQALALLASARGEAASAVLDFTVGNLQFQAERLDPAGEAYEIAVQKHPKFRRAWRNLALIRTRQNDFERASQALIRVIELGGGDAIVYGLLGFAHSSLGHDIAAESAYRMATLLDGGTLDWKLGLARSFFRQQRYADAAALLEQLIAAQPERGDLWLLQANASIGLGRPMDAAKSYEIVDRLGQSTPDSLNMLGDIYTNEELFGLAVGCYVRAMQAAPEADPDRAIRAARVLIARGGLDETRDLLARIEDLHGERLGAPQRKDLLKLRARVAVASGAGDEEAKVLEEIVALDPLDGEALILLGQHASRSGDSERAAFCYERAASLEGFEADAKVRLAQLLVKQGRYAEALPHLRRAQVIQPRENIQQYLDQVERVAQTR